MESLSQAWPALAAYSTALAALMLLILAVLVQAFLAGVIGLNKSGGELPGVPLQGNHANLNFRVLRTYGNSVENLPVFTATLLLAIIASASPKWVNALAAIHVAFRLLFWGVYYSGIGKVAGGPRTIAYVLGWFTNLALAVITTVALFA